MTHMIGRLAVAAAMLTLLLATPGTASAASRSFDVENHTKWDLRLDTLRHVECDYWWKWRSTCAGQKWYEMEFEGNPEVGSVLEAGDKQDFELKYEFTRQVGGRPNYAARIAYDAPGPRARVEIYINTTNWGRNSECDTRSFGAVQLQCSTDGGGTIKIRTDDD